MLFRQGDIGTNWYAVLSGSLSVNVYSTSDPNDEVTICTLGTGTVFGDSILNNSPRHATVITNETCELLRVEQKDFILIWEKHRQLMEGLINMTDRIQAPKPPSTDYGNYQANVEIPTEENLNTYQRSTTQPFHSEVSIKIGCLPHEPICTRPSERMAQAGRVLRILMLTRTPSLIKDRKQSTTCTHRRCAVGTEMVDWLLTQAGNLLHTRAQAVGCWQAHLEEGVLFHVTREHEFKDANLYYRFLEDDVGLCSSQPTAQDKKDAEEFLPEVLPFLAQTGPDAILRMILRRSPGSRTADEIETVYDELLNIRALSHLSTMVKRELAGVIMFEAHPNAGTALFNQGDPSLSWYIIMKGSVNVVIQGKGVVCTLHEGDDFGKLALVNNAPRAASIILRDENCQLLRVDKHDFNSILHDVEANTARVKGEDNVKDVLVLEKIPVKIQSGAQSQIQYRYSIMAGTPEKMLSYLLETRMDSNADVIGDPEDTFLEDFLLTYPVFMVNAKLCSLLIRHYTSIPLSQPAIREDEPDDAATSNKKKVIHLVLRWVAIAGHEFKEDSNLSSFISELHDLALNDVEKKGCAQLKGELNALEQAKSGKVSFITDYRKQNRQYSTARKEERAERRKTIKGTDENIFKVYCFDHTYTTLRLPMDTKAESIAKQAARKLCLNEDMILVEVKSTGEKCPFKPNDVSVTSALSINGRLFVATRDQIDSLVPLPDQEGPKTGTANQLELMSSKEVAYQLTVLDYELLSCIHEYEFIYHIFGRYNFGKITANLDIFLRRFNEVQFWVVTEMCLCQNLPKMVTLLRKFIKIAQYCKEYQNLNAFFAIVMGLNNVAVSRLREPWEKLPVKLRKMYHEFENMLDPTRNHRLYRLAISKLHPPVIPFLPLLMKDMAFTHESNRTYFDGLVNFEKMHMFASTIRHIQHCRSEPFNFEPPMASRNIQEVRTYVRNLKVTDNQRLLTQLSHRIEQRR